MVDSTIQYVVHVTNNHSTKHSTTSLLITESVLIALVLIALGYIVIARRRLRQRSHACAATSSALRHHALIEDRQSRTTDTTLDEHTALNSENNSDTPEREQ